MKPKLILCLALVLSGGLVYGGETTTGSSTNSFLRAILSRLSDKVPEWSVENLSQGAPYATNTVSAFYTNSGGIRLEIIAKAYDSEVAAKNGQESDARGISVNADKMEIIKGVKVYEYTRYGGLYFQIGFYTFRFEIFHGGNEDLQRLLLKVCSALISEFDSDVANRIPVGIPPSWEYKTIRRFDYPGLNKNNDFSLEYAFPWKTQLSLYEQQGWSVDSVSVSEQKLASGQTIQSALITIKRAEK